MTADAISAPWCRVLADGHTLVVPTGRLGAVLRAAWDRAQADTGATAWAAPRLQSWQEWLADAAARHPAALGHADVLLSPAQELALWTRVVADDAMPSFTPRATGALARLAQQAWAVRHGYDVDTAGAGATLEQRAFAAWSARFAEACTALRVIDAPRVLDRLPPGARDAAAASAGFFTASPAVRRLLPPDITPGAGSPVQPLACLRYPDPEDEIAAALAWVAESRTSGVRAPVLACADPVLAEALERALLRGLRPAAAPPDEPRPFRAIAGDEPPPLVTLALEFLDPQGEPTRARAAALVTSPYFGAGMHSAGDAFPARVRAAHVLLTGGVDPVAWPRVQAACREAGCHDLEPLWDAQRTLAGDARRRLSIRLRLARIEQALAGAGWPGHSALDTAEDEDYRRWRRVLDEVATLDLVLAPQTHGDVLQAVRRAVQRGAWGPSPALDAVEILSLEELAVLAPARARIVGLHAGAWPPVADVTPFLPVLAQRRAGVPAACRDQAFERARALLGALGTCALTASFAAHADDAEQLPVQGLALALADGAPGPATPGPTTAFEPIPDVPVPLTTAERVRGGSAVLTDQSACPFRAFARHRLHAGSLDDPQLGPDARLRGELVHRVLARFWSQWRSQAAVHALSTAERAAAIADAVDGTFATLGATPPGTGLERDRVARIAAEWLAVDLARPPFAVVACEAARRLTLEALTLELRIDRIDRLAHGGTLLIDYKTGRDVSPRHWQPPRPEQPQLLSYALAEPDAQGIAFGCVRTGDCRLLTSPSKVTTEAPDPAAWAAMRADWQSALGALAREFVTGAAEVAPRDAQKTCRQCDLHVLCRVHEVGALAADAADDA